VFLLTRVHANSVVGTKKIQTHVKGGASNGKNRHETIRRPDGSKKIQMSE
jgi:hypothetical protein